MIDTSGDGNIEYSEFSTIFDPPERRYSKSKLLVHAHVRESNISEFDVDDGAKDLEAVDPTTADLLRDRVQNKLVNKDKNAAMIPQLLSAFKSVDPRQDGYITYNEFRRAMGMNGLNLGLDKAEIEKLLSVCDADRDGCVTISEFVRALTRAEKLGDDLIHDERLGVIETAYERTQPCVTRSSDQRNSLTGSLSTPQLSPIKKNVLHSSRRSSRAKTCRVVK